MAIKKNNVIKSLSYQKLSRKTQMIRNIVSSKGNVTFTTRLSHTKDVARICQRIVKDKNIDQVVKIDRLICAALLHDIGHAPFGHAGEEAINDLFLSIDESHYSEGFPGLFRHNINSVKLMARHFKFNSYDDYVILDSVLKHTSTVPKNYNHGIFTDENILKMNYIFRSINFGTSGFLNDFFEIYSKNKCLLRTPKVINRNICFVCDRHDICFFTENVKNKNEILSCYLKYPYPLTFEGTILRWADEISCFIGDLRDVAKYVVYYENDVETLIAISRLKSVTSLLESKYPKNKVFDLVNKYISNLENERMASNAKLEGCIKSLLDIETWLINSLNVQPNTIGNDCPIHLKINASGCNMLFGLNKKNEEVLTRIKNAIYTDVHNIKYIKKTNDVGRKILRFLVFYYMRRFDIFVIDYEGICKIDKNRLIKSLSDSLYSLLSIQNKNGLTRTKFMYRIRSQLTSHNFGVDSISISKIQLFQKLVSKISPLKDYKRISNLFKREIGYFVASLDENEIINILRSKSEKSEKAKKLSSLLSDLSFN